MYFDNFCCLFHYSCLNNSLNFNSIFCFQKYRVAIYIPMTVVWLLYLGFCCCLGCLFVCLREALSMQHRLALYSQQAPLFRLQVLGPQLCVVTPAPAGLMKLSKFLYDINDMCNKKYLQIGKLTFKSYLGSIHVYLYV